MPVTIRIPAGLYDKVYELLPTGLSMPRWILLAVQEKADRDARVTMTVTDPRDQL